MTHEFINCSKLATVLPDNQRPTGPARSCFKSLMNRRHETSFPTAGVGVYN